MMLLCLYYPNWLFILKVIGGNYISMTTRVEMKRVGCNYQGLNIPGGQMDS